jgi:hypothetical protein
MAGISSLKSVVVPIVRRIRIGKENDNLAEAQFSSRFAVELFSLSILLPANSKGAN